jgi:hypothetical protein
MTGNWIKRTSTPLLLFVTTSLFGEAVALSDEKKYIIGEPPRCEAYSRVIKATNYVTRIIMGEPVGIFLDSDGAPDREFQAFKFYILGYLNGRGFDLQSTPHTEFEFYWEISSLCNSGPISSDLGTAIDRYTVDQLMKK